MWYEAQKGSFTYLFFETEEAFLLECEYDEKKDTYKYNGCNVFNHTKRFPKVFQKYCKDRFFIECNSEIQKNYRKYVKKHLTN